MNNVLIDFTAYRFIPLTDEEKQSGIITKLTIDATGVQIDEPQKRVRISNIVFKLREPNPVYLKDYLNVDVIYPDLSGLVDVKQQNVLKKNRVWCSIPRHLSSIS